jgi:hypothetical protein
LVSFTVWCFGSDQLCVSFLWKPPQLHLVRLRGT